MRTGVFILLFGFVISICANFAFSAAVKEEESESDLPPKVVFAKIKGLQDDVTAKMKNRETSMNKILSAIIKGDYEVIQEEAEKINVQYSIEYNMEPEVQAEYNSIIVSDFVFIDQDLNQYTSALASSAEEKYLEGTLIYFDQVLRTCVNCHYTFAKEKFPKLAHSVIE